MKHKAKLSSWMSNVQKNLRACREAAGYSHETLAKKIKVSRSTISELESGKKENISLELLCRIAEGLDLEAEELLIGPNLQFVGREKKELQDITRDANSLYKRLQKLTQKST